MFLERLLDPESASKSFTVLFQKVFLIYMQEKPEILLFMVRSRSMGMSVTGFPNYLTPP